MKWQQRRRIAGDRNKVIKKLPLPFPPAPPLLLNNRLYQLFYDCNTSHGLIPYDLFKCWKFRFVFWSSAAGPPTSSAWACPIKYTPVFIERVHHHKKPISNMLEKNKPHSCPLQSAFGVRPYALKVIMIYFITLNYNHTFSSSYGDHDKPRIWVGWGSYFNPL